MDLYDQLPNSKLTYLSEYASMLESAKENGITVVDLLTLKPAELTKVFPRSIIEIAKFQLALRDELKYQVFELNKPEFSSDEHRMLVFTSGDRDIDKALGGGIRTHGITEIFGSSSTGKSQLLMQLSLSVQASTDCGGLDGKCVFITTEGNLPTKRLDEMITYKSKLTGFESVSQNNIFTVNCNDLASQEHILLVQLPILVERNRDIKLIIIDSISHHLRVELESKTFRDSQDNRHYIDRMAQNLLKIAAKYSLAIVVANQVGDKPVPEGNPINSISITGPAEYGYQLGWTVGWKDSSIFYRQTMDGLTFDSGSKVRSDSHIGNEHILSDDEDYNLIAATALARKRGRDGGSTDQLSANNSSQSVRTGPKQQSQNYCTSTHVTPCYGRKRKVDTKVPNLGLSWANHVGARILLAKSYKASPMIKEKDFDLNRVLDTNSFWQPRRTLQVVFSEFTKRQELEFMISANGVESIERAQVKPKEYLG
ncbi:LANO_0C03906g1_1 [Lachancea nothofagi CBS 11611]|uniref:LANO_0C03906g1_1 n=1 Tax=Lachancea nothofagi CBS 11611 TaxID=1266666 RepID=A0A1G4J641_9SACH|nr:LANO_0C03906g1_1 [Lachancea nothofagi CBS 11611]